MSRFLMEAGNPKGFTGEALSRSSFRAGNPTPGTGIVSQNDAVANTATIGLMNVFNSALIDGTEPYVIRPVWLKLFGGVINTTASEANMTLYLDEINRYTSGGTAITEQALIHTGESGYTLPVSKATIHFGELLLTAVSDANLVGHIKMSKIELVADDHFDIYFAGGAPGGSRDGTMLRGPGPFEVPPVWIRPGANLSFHWWATAQAADPAFEFEFFYTESPNANQDT